MAAHSLGAASPSTRSKRGSHSDRVPGPSTEHSTPSPAGYSAPSTSASSASPSNVNVEADSPSGLSAFPRAPRRPSSIVVTAADTKAASSSDDDGAGSSSKSKKRRGAFPRTSLACLHCRRRKVRCDGAQPACSLCAKFKRPCIYERVTEEENLKARELKQERRRKRGEHDPRSAQQRPDVASLYGSRALSEQDLPALGQTTSFQTSPRSSRPQTSIDSVEQPSPQSMQLAPGAPSWQQEHLHAWNTWRGGPPVISPASSISSEYDAFWAGDRADARPALPTGWESPNAFESGDHFFAPRHSSMDSAVSRASTSDSADQYGRFPSGPTSSTNQGLDIAFAMGSRTFESTAPADNSYYDTQLPTIFQRRLSTRDGPPVHGQPASALPGNMTIPPADWAHHLPVFQALSAPASASGVGFDFSTNVDPLAHPHAAPTWYGEQDIPLRRTRTSEADSSGLTRAAPIHTAWPPQVDPASLLDPSQSFADFALAPFPPGHFPGPTAAASSPGLSPPHASSPHARIPGTHSTSHPPTPAQPMWSLDGSQLAPREPQAQHYKDASN